MRVSELQIFRVLKNNLKNAAIKNMEMQNIVSTGKKLNSPSDNPVDFAKKLDYDRTLQEIEQYRRNIDNGNVNISIAETVLGEALDILVEAKDVAIFQATGSATAETREIEAIQVENIANQLAFIGNTKIGNKYLFSGFKTSTQPFDSTSSGSYTGTAIDPAGASIVINAGVNDTLDITMNGQSGTITLTAGTYSTGADLADEIEAQINASADFSTNSSVRFITSAGTLVLETIETGPGNDITVTGGTATTDLGLAAGTAVAGAAAGNTFNGDTGSIDINIDESTNITTNITGDIIFKGSSGGIDLFDSLDSLRQALLDNDTTGIQEAIDELESGIQQVLNAKTTLGTKLSLLENKDKTISEREFQFLKIKNSIEDADIIDAISDLVSQQTALEAARASAGKILSTSLLDFIR